MIDQATRDTLKAKTQYGDYERAAQIYQKLGNKTITARYIHKFIHGHKNPTGRPGRHDPLLMFNALTQAVQERLDKAEHANQSAKKLLQQILRDTTPQTPIPL